MKNISRPLFSKENNPNYDLDSFDYFNSDRELGKTAVEYVMKASDEIYKLIKLAEYDSLTGCHSRLFLEKYIEKKFDPELDSSTLALVFTDLNNLKEINDSVGYGHLAGDELIKGMVNYLRLELGDETDIIRTGGDEFLCIVNNKKNEENFQDNLTNLLEKGRGISLSSISKEVPDKYQNIPLEYSYGIAIYDKNTDMVVDNDGLVDKKQIFSKILKRSDRNMYVYKEKTKGHK